ncbi:MAG: lytic transglycosylase domain-containing protein [Opitutaceae bacterium]|jgi:membrane-bound lytic murein transglycosylase D|nr:lytic transglycosylase domain-containing protein [Opitutaceae bacterium]
MRRRFALLLSAALAAILCPPPPDAAADGPSAPAAGGASGTAPPEPAPRPLTQADFDALYELGSQLFEDYAPDQIKEHYQFLTKDEWHAFTAGLQRSLATGSLEELAALESEAGRTLAGLRLMPEFSDYADWLAKRLDLIESARHALSQPPSRPRPPPLLVRPHAAPLPPAKTPAPAAAHAPAPAHAAPALAEGGGPPPPLPFTIRPHPLHPLPPTHPLPPLHPLPPPHPLHPALSPHPLHPTLAAHPLHPPVPYYDIWLTRLRDRPAPHNSVQLIPLLKVIFNAERIPAELVWLAEVESSFNTDALSPAGARGLFQLMPATAKALGLRTWPFDERTQPGKSARAAAQLLRRLHARFDSWPLALAAYNAGEGRVAAALKKTPGASVFADIAEKLPAETRLYVPKVLATITVRENVPLSRFASAALPAGPGTGHPLMLASFFP